jgi:5'-3' exonuclease
MSNAKYLSIFEEIKKKGGSVDFDNPDKKVLIVDGLNTFIRVFSVMPTLNENGVHVGGIVGFLKSIGFAINMFNPTRTIIVFDGKGGSNRRRKLYSDYKNKRRTSYRVNRVESIGGNVDEERKNMYMQLRRVADYLELLPLTTISVDGIEADDAIAYIAKSVIPNGKKVIMSTDKDFLQLVSDDIKVWSPTKKKLYDKEAVLEEYGLTPENFILNKIIEGDKSDNIPGVNGVANKTLIKNIPTLAEDNTNYRIDELLKYSHENKDSGGSFFIKILQSKDILERNYKLMQLENVEISASTKTKLIDLIRGPIRRLVKYKFESMFMEDRLFQNLPNVSSWLAQTFTTMDKYAEQTNG